MVIVFDLTFVRMLTLAYNRKAARGTSLKVFRQMISVTNIDRSWSSRLIFSINVVNVATASQCLGTVPKIISLSID